MASLGHNELINHIVIPWSEILDPIYVHFTSNQSLWDKSKYNKQEFSIVDAVNLIL